jgi:tetratricopeptide (TPR) repeat protein
MTISVCMMVKIATDADVRLMRGAMNSIAFVADEVCIIDTYPEGRLGEALYPVSDDGEILFGQTLVGAKTTVKQSPWQADFALHRNESLDMATGDWLLVIDHDEELVCPNPGELKRFLESIDVNRVQILVNNLDAKGRLQHPFNQARLFRKGSVHYEGRAHHQPMPVALGVHCGLASINHYGYGLGAEVLAAKRKRTETILKAWQLEEPDNIHIDYWLAKSATSAKEPERAAKYAERYLRKAIDVPTKDMHFSAFWMASNALLLLDRRVDAVQWVREGLERIPDDPDLLFLKSELAAARQDWDECLKASTEFVEVYSVNNGIPNPKQPYDSYTLKPECISLSLSRVAHISLYKGLRALGLSLGFLKDLPDDQAKELSENSRLMIQQILSDIHGLLEVMNQEDKESAGLCLVR